MIRVNHAGEYGAIRIYEGQQAILGKSSVGPTLQHMAQQERNHFKLFDETMKKRRVRPTVLQPLWHVAGFALGAGSALLGKRAAMACTVAVESVIDAHYQQQLEVLKNHPEEKDHQETIAHCHQEELEHQDQAFAQGADRMPGYGPFSHAVKAASRLAIFLSKRL
jgi:ubiquinone biosynthesis monooxygenase Coq7